MKKWVSLTLKSITAKAIFTALLAVLSAAPSYAKSEYTVNGHRVAEEISALLSHQGYPAGDYYVDQFGNYGQIGQPPQGNLDGGPVSNWQGEPQGIANNPYAQAYVNGIQSVRIFWIYSPSVFSGATGGASGYYHICPERLYYRSSEGAINIGTSNGWAGSAGTDTGGGHWTLEESENGPYIILAGSDGAHQFLLENIIRGKWQQGQFKYAVEFGKASCF